MKLSELFLPEFDQEMSSVRKTLERIPEDKLSYKPHPKSMPLDRLAGHLAELSGWAVPTIQQDSLDIIPAGGPPMQPTIATSRQHVLEVFDKNRDQARRAMGAWRFVASATPLGGDFELALRGESDRPLALDGLTGVHCWPVSLGAGHAVVPTVDDRELSARFGRVSADALTAFFAVELAAEHAGAEDSVRFVVNADLRGAPADRRERVLVDLLRSRADVLRYLVFLLSGDSIDAQQLADALTGEGAGADRRDGWAWEAPLLEAMVRALAGDPERLDHLARVIADIRRTGKAADLLPEDLDLVWEPIWQARQELRS